MLTRAQRDQWAEELESGKWRQCHGFMRGGGQERCCLGVLAEAVFQNRFWNTQDLMDAYILERASDFVIMNDGDLLSFPEIAKHVRSLPVSDEPQP